MIEGCVRFLMAAVVLLAGIHCGCAPCFAENPATATAMGEMPCCQHETPASTPRQDSVPHPMPGDHMACAAVDSADAASMSKPLGPVAGIVALPAEVLTFTSLAPVFEMTGDHFRLPPPRDGGTLLRLHCALTV